MIRLFEDSEKNKTKRRVGLKEAKKESQLLQARKKKHQKDCGLNVRIVRPYLQWTI